MNTFKQLHLTPGKAICYSGFRDGQYPGGTSPSYEQVKEDLLLLSKDWSYLRLYDCDEHATISDENAQDYTHQDEYDCCKQIVMDAIKSGGSE